MTFDLLNTLGLIEDLSNFQIAFIIVVVLTMPGQVQHIFLICGFFLTPHWVEERAFA